MKPFDYPFKANGKEYNLRYSFRARLNFERKHKGKTVPGMLKRLSDPDTQTADELVDMFRLLLSGDHPDMKPEEIEKIIDDLGGEDEALKLFMDALSDQVPAEDGVRPQ